MTEQPEGFETAHLPYIEAVVKGLEDAGLNVGSWEDRTDEIREAIVTVLTVPGDAENANWDEEYTLYWDENDGWMYGEPKNSHGELTNILWLADGVVPAPADVTADAKLAASGGWTSKQFSLLATRVRYREARDEDEPDPEFEAELAAYATESAPAVGPSEAIREAAGE